MNAGSQLAIEVTRDLEYLEGDRVETLDVYRPAGAQAAPAILYIHGGSFYRGSKSSPRSESICRDLASAGFVAFSVDYKLSTGNHGEARWSSWPQNLSDCRSAWRFVGREGARFGADVDRLGVLGASAGATLALLMAFSERADHPELAAEPPLSARPRALVNLYARTDWLRHTERAKAAVDLELARRASPLSYVTRERVRCPVLTVHGEQDLTVPVAHALMLDEAMREAGLEHELRVLPKTGHSFRLFSPIACDDVLIDVRMQVFAFLYRNLRVPGL